MIAFGGLLVHGIPDFRLPKKIIKDTINKILDLGIKVELNKELGKDILIDELKENYDAVLLCFGANISTKMGVEGEELDGVYGANELLEYEDYPDFFGKTIAVIGGGNTAMDTARTINKKGAKNVFIIYRRDRKEMPAEDAEVDAAIDEGIFILFQNNIVKIIGKEHVEKVECIRTELIEVKGGRAKPVDREGTNHILEVDYVVMALGSKPEEKIVKSLGLDIDEWGYIKVDENNQTSMKKVFAAGDLVGAKHTVAWASRSGREAAENILKEI